MKKKHLYTLLLFLLPTWLAKIFIVLIDWEKNVRPYEDSLTDENVNTCYEAFKNIIKQIELYDNKY